MSDVVLETIDGRPTLRFTREVAAPLADVWRAVSEPGVTSEWFLPMSPFTKVSELDELLGQVQGAPVSAEPQSQVVWAMDDGQLTFRLAAAAHGVVVEMLLTMDDGAQAAIAAMTFDAFLDRLVPFLAGEKLPYGAFGGDLDEQARQLEAYAIRLGVDPQPGRDWVTKMRGVLAAGEEDEGESDYEPDPDAAEQLEAAMLPYLREHKAELDAAEARRGSEMDPSLLDEWLLPSAQDASEYVKRWKFMMDRYIADESMSVADVDAAWRAAHPDA